MESAYLVNPPCAEKRQQFSHPLTRRDIPAFRVKFLTVLDSYTTHLSHPEMHQPEVADASEQSVLLETDAGFVKHKSPKRADVRRGLQERHIQMISLAGMIGTGLFLASGQTLADSGPLGSLLGFVTMGFVTAAVAYTSGEMSAFMPAAGGFVRHTSNFVDPDLGAIVGWNFWYSISITQAVEIVAASILMSYWNTGISVVGWITVFWSAIILLNLMPIKYYGEVEFVFAIVKISLIVSLIVLGLIIDLGIVPGQERIGFRYWKDPGPFRQFTYGLRDTVVPGVKGRFLAFWSTLINASFAYGNVQAVAIAGSETLNPRQVIPRAVKRTFLRVVTFYVLSIFVIGLILPSTEPGLRGAGDSAGKSPWVIAITRAGIRCVPSVINAVVVSSAFSSGVSCVFISSRTLLGLASDGQAPPILLKTTRLGVPYVAVLTTASFGAFAYFSVTQRAMNVLIWLINLSAVAGLVSWVVICVTYIRFRAGLKAQGYTADDLPYRSPFQPFTAWFALVSCALILVFSGFPVFMKGNFTASGFLSNYSNIFLFAGAYTAYKFFTGSTTTYIPADLIDLSEFEVIKAERVGYDE